MIRKLLFLAAAASVLGRAAAAGPVVLSAQATQDVQEAAFRHLFAGANPQMTHCLVVPGPVGGPQSADPSPEFLARFADLKTPVKNRSGCNGKAADGIGVADTVTGALAMFFSVGPVTCSSDTECELEAGYYAAPTAAASWIYDLQKKDGTWVVTGEHMQWIS